MQQISLNFLRPTNTYLSKEYVVIKEVCDVIVDVKPNVLPANLENLNLT